MSNRLVGVGVAVPLSGSRNRVNGYFAPRAEPRTSASSRFPFPCSVWQDEEGFVLEADLPGVKEADLDIRLLGNTLTINVERRPGDQPPQWNTRTFGRFEGSLELPEAVDAERAGAQLRDGVLRLTLPKHATARPKTIRVSRGE